MAVPEYAVRTTQTPLGQLALAARPSSYSSNVSDIGQLAQQRQGQSLDILSQGRQEATRLSDLGRREVSGLLEPFIDTRAFQERNALLGLMGEQAQQEAIGGIPVSEFDRELQRRQLEQQARQAQATGDLGGGAFIADRASLASQQQAQTIQNRLSQLSPLIQLSQGVASQLSGIDEDALMRNAEMAYGTGLQRGQVYLNAADPMIQNIQNQAEIRALQRQASAGMKSGIIGGLAGIAGQFLG